jgi:hypothetical protein
MAPSLVKHVGMAAPLGQLGVLAGRGLFSFFCQLLPGPLLYCDAQVNSVDHFETVKESTKNFNVSHFSEKMKSTQVRHK